MNLNFFKNPPNEYKPVPFWSWNERLDAKELKRQIAQMESQGLGGFFMHSRIGLETPYLSEDWFHCVKECVEEAKSRNMGAWLYDEDKWPSGYAGGRVPRLGEEYREKALCASEGEIPYPPEEIKILKIYAFKRRRTEEVYTEFPSYSNSFGYDFGEPKEITAEEIPGLEENTSVVYYYIWTSPMKYPWLNGTCYVDLLNSKVTEAFIESTHEKYAGYLKEGFGKEIPGIFTDEPGYLMYGGRFTGRKNVLPWSYQFDTEFYKEYGYELTEKLPCLFFSMKGYEKVRCDYRRLVDKLFVNHYSKLIYQWCEKHNLKFTGHYLAEDYLTCSLERLGSVMQHYLFMHYPGIDHLMRKADDIITQKQLQSVVNQFSKERALCEIFGCAGQDFSFEGQKWIADWNFVNGVNIINPHLMLYSMRGVRKRDFPPNLSYQQPWWEYYHLVTGYQTRLSYALSQGKRVVEVLVLHPMESGFITFTPGDKIKTGKIDEQFENVLWVLMKNHYDFDLGDEGIISEHGEVAGRYFKIVAGSYKVVVLPPMLTLRRSTLKLLKEFIGHGGKVIAVKDYPVYIDGEPEVKTVAEALKGAVLSSYYTLAGLLEKQLEPQVIIKQKDGGPAEKIFYHKRNIDGNILYFFCNNDKEALYKVKILLGEHGKVMELDPSNGNTAEYPSSREKKYTCLEHDFEPCGSLLVYVKTRDAAAANNENSHKRCAKSQTDIPLTKPWKLEVTDENVIALDYCTYTDDGGEAGPMMPCIKVQGMINGLKPEALKLRYTFRVDGWDGTGGQLVIESPENYGIAVNGTSIEYEDTGYWRDISFKRVPIGKLIVQGENIVELIYKDKGKVEIEPVYILGKFKAAMEHNRYFRLVSGNTTEFIEDAVNEGYPFYAGKLVLSKQVNIDIRNMKVCKLRMGQVNATAVKVWVNGKEAGHIIWRPYELDLTEYVRQGENTIGIELVNSLHNVLGPHHDVRGEVVPFVGPDSFEDQDNWVDTYYFRPFGIKEAVLHIDKEMGD